jgi:hypothetical protein
MVTRTNYKVSHANFLSLLLDPFSCSKYSPEHPALIHQQTMIFLHCQRPRFTHVKRQKQMPFRKLDGSFTENKYSNARTT